MRGYRAFTSLSIGLASGRSLPLTAGDVIPPSWAAVNQHQLDQLAQTGAVRLVADVDAQALREAEAAAGSA